MSLFISSIILGVSLYYSTFGPCCVHCLQTLSKRLNEIDMQYNKLQHKHGLILDDIDKLKNNNDDAVETKLMWILGGIPSSAKVLISSNE